MQLGSLLLRLFLGGLAEFSVEFLLKLGEALALFLCFGYLLFQLAAFLLVGLVSLYCRKLTLGQLGLIEELVVRALYRAAEYVCKNEDMQLVQLVSFGCGIDAVTTDEVRAILEEKGKLYTQLKIDEITNLGAAKIRLRSLAAALEEKEESKNAG